MLLIRANAGVCRHPAGGYIVEETPAGLSGDVPHWGYVIAGRVDLDGHGNGLDDEALRSHRPAVHAASAAVS